MEYIEKEFQKWLENIKNNYSYILCAPECAARHAFEYAYNLAHDVDLPDCEDTDFKKIYHSTVGEILKEKLGFELCEKEISLSDTFREDLNCDSLDLVELFMAFEDYFDIKIRDEEVEHIKTVQDAIDYFRKKGIPEENLKL